MYCNVTQISSQSCLARDAKKLSEPSIQIWLYSCELPRGVPETIHYCAITHETAMSSHISRASKRLRVAQQPTAAWMCNSCKRSFASTARPLQTPEQQREEAEKTTHFGYQTVAESLKASKGEAAMSPILQRSPDNR